MKKVKKTVINTCEDGTAHTIVAWYAKGEEVILLDGMVQIGL